MGDEQGDLSQDMAAGNEGKVKEESCSWQHLGPEVGEEEEEEEESCRAVGVKAQLKVSSAEREEHGLTHTSYRSWCTICVKAKGQKMQHF